MVVARVQSVFLGQIVDCLTSGRKSGETVGFEGKEVEDSTSLPPVLDFREAIHHMWPVDAFHSAKDVVFTPDFRISVMLRRCVGVVVIMDPFRWG